MRQAYAPPLYMPSALRGKSPLGEPDGLAGLRLEAAPDAAEQLLDREAGLEEISLHAQCPGLEDARAVRHRRDQDHRAVAVPRVGSELFEQFQPVGAGDHDFEQDEV